MGKLTGKLKQMSRKGKATVNKTEVKARRGTRRAARKADRAV